MLKTIKLYTLKGWIAWYVNYVLIKLLFKKKERKGGSEGRREGLASPFRNPPFQAKIVSFPRCVRFAAVLQVGF